MVGIILWSELTDDELLKATANGECDAFTELVNRWWERIVGFFRRRVVDHHVAEDMANQTFLDIFRGLHRWSMSYSAASWIYRNARWELRNIPRRNRRRIASEGSVATLADRNPSPVDNAIRREAAVIVRRKVEQLPGVMASAIWHVVAEGETLEVAGLRRGVSRQAVDQAVSRSCVRLAADADLQSLMGQIQEAELCVA